MKRILIVFAISVFSCLQLSAQTSAEIGPNSLTLPRLTTSQRNALTTAFSKYINSDFFD